MQRLLTLLEDRRVWQETFAQIRAMREWLLEAEAIFAGQWASLPKEVTPETVGARLDQWLERLSSYVSTLAPSTPLFEGLVPLVDTLTHLRPHLVCCYAVEGLPRTNNDLERCIRAIKTRPSRVSVAARIGMPMSCATAVAWRSMNGGRLSPKGSSAWKLVCLN